MNLPLSNLRIDVGCGPNKHKDCTVGVDRYDLYALYREGEFIQADILKDGLPFGDNEVDWIYCHHMLEHLPQRHPEKDIDALIFVMNEFHRVLKPGCEAYLVVPWIGHSNAWRNPVHYRFFDQNTFSYFTRALYQAERDAEGVVGKWGARVNRIQDECHILAIMVKVE